MRVGQARRSCLRRRLWVLAVLLALAAGRAGSAEDWRLADGRAAVPAGIVGLVPLVPGTGLGLVDPAGVTVDRHGRVRGQLTDQNGDWLQAGLVARGLAAVAPAADVAPDVLAELLRLERDARGRGLGRWAGGAAGPYPAERVGMPAGSFVLVRGTVRTVSRRGELTYLDFGEDWRRDFTIRAETRSAPSGLGLTSPGSRANGSLSAAGCSTMPARWSSSCIRCRSRWRNEAHGPGSGGGGRGARAGGLHAGAQSGHRRAAIHLADARRRAQARAAGTSQGLAAVRRRLRRQVGPGLRHQGRATGSRTPRS